MGRTGSIWDCGGWEVGGDGLANWDVRGFGGREGLWVTERRSWRLQDCRNSRKTPHSKFQEGV